MHCFDGHEQPGQGWRPGIGLQNHGSSDISGSIIFSAQTVGSHTLKPGDFLFGHACQSGGLIFRNGVAKVRCGNPFDAGQECGTSHPWCAPLSAEVRSTTATVTDGGAFCGGAWHPADIHAYLARHTREQMKIDGWERAKYNEFLIDGLAWDRGLPNTIDAFLSGGEAATIRQQFLAAHGIAAEDVPLVRITSNPHALFVAG